MELCGPNVSETGGPLPCHSVPLCRLQAGGRHVHNLPHLPHQPWVNHPAPAVASGPVAAVRHRGSGATAASHSSAGCAASRLAEEAAVGQGASGGKVVVTGGGGYFGFRLVRQLASEGLLVVLLDMNKPPCEIPDGAIFCQGDIRDYSSLYKVCEGADCIFHTASYGMTGPEQLRKEQVESINVGGTNNVINVCKERSVPRLVYTSTINAVFTGRPIVNGDEASVPLVSPDVVSSTSRIPNDEFVLSLTDGGLLRTCVLRPCGIYGPEERRHMHRVMMNVERRLFSFRFGDPQARMNWVHVNNLVLAHTLAAEALTPKKSCVAVSPLHITHDQKNPFEQLGFKRPLLGLPVSLVYSPSSLEWRNSQIFYFQVKNIAVTHTFKIDKARRELGYNPNTYSLADSVELYLKSREPRSRSSLLDVSWTSQLLRHRVLLLMLPVV
uniref:Short chain dehydrogenase/reductase family 42E, member 2 n=1 Tax=Salarias fasciatus TaxID=181472 RepID=A0A672FUK8_SALFA